jgi:hypothetical protein
MNDEGDEQQQKEEEDMIVMDAIGVLRREISYSYPYCAGSVTFTYTGYPKKILSRILKHFQDRDASIVIQPHLQRITIKDYMGGF